MLGGCPRGSYCASSCELDWRLRLLQVGVTAGYGYVEYPLMTFFFRFDQTLVFERHQVFLHPRDLLLGHAPALNVDCNAG